MRKTFYCAAYTNTSPFTDAEQDLIEMDLKDAGWDEMEIFTYIHPDACTEQCDRCINEMLEKRAQTQKLVDKLKNKNV